MCLNLELYIYSHWKLLEEKGEHEEGSWIVKIQW